MGSAPKAPDPKETAAAQSGLNVDTAITQQLINATNQYNPWGSITYTPDGESTFVNSQGETVTIPKFTQTTSYTPEQQEIFDLQQSAQTNLAGLANEQSAFLKEYLNKPFEFTNDDASNFAYDLGAQRLDPRFEKQQADLEQQLYNKGIMPGSPAWNSEMSNLSQAKNDAYNQLTLQGQQQAFSQALAAHNQPINEITALLSGTQLQNPGAQSPGTPQASVAGVDYTGLVNQKYQADLQAHQSKMGGLFGLASAGLGLFSDRRLKYDIKRVGVTKHGLPLYEYRYIWDDQSLPVRRGVMADDVLGVAPEAVHTDPVTGMHQVNYHYLGLQEFVS